MRTEVYDAVESVFGHHDLLLGPTVICPTVENATDKYAEASVITAGAEYKLLRPWSSHDQVCRDRPL